MDGGLVGCLSSSRKHLSSPPELPWPPSCSFFTHESGGQNACFGAVQPARTTVTLTAAPFCERRADSTHRTGTRSRSQQTPPRESSRSARGCRDSCAERAGSWPSHCRARPSPAWSAGTWRPDGAHRGARARPRGRHMARALLRGAVAEGAVDHHGRVALVLVAGGGDGVPSPRSPRTMVLRAWEAVERAERAVKATRRPSLWLGWYCWPR